MGIWPDMDAGGKKKMKNLRRHFDIARTHVLVTMFSLPEFDHLTNKVFWGVVERFRKEIPNFDNILDFRNMKYEK